MHIVDFSIAAISVFGKMQILFMDGGAAVTDSRAPSKIYFIRRLVKVSNILLQIIMVS